MEHLDKAKATVGGEVEEHPHKAFSFEYLSEMEAWRPGVRRDKERWAEYLERAESVIEGNVDETRYKILTLGQLRRSERSHLVGKKGEEMWNDGERVLAFEDGTLAFKESGADLWASLDNADELAAWISFLDRFHESWESGPPPKLPIWSSGGMVDLSTSD
jgi:hypothetical protein